MEIEIRSFASFREAIGEKTIHRTVSSDATVGDVLGQLVDEYPELEIFEADGTPRPYITILKNGKDVVHANGMDEELEDGDTISAFPPVAGG